jgi:thiamine transport system substrate-binding protein
VLGLDTNLTADAKASGLFAALPALTSPAWTSPAAGPTIRSCRIDYGYFAVVYDTETMPNPPTSLKELVEGDAEQKIVIEDPRTSTPGLGLLLWVKAVYGDKAPRGLGHAE